MAYMDAAERKRIAETINKVGFRKLREYCEGKPHPVKDFERDVEILKRGIKYGPSACVVKFNISRQAASAKIRRYEEYAKRLLEGKAFK